MLKLKVMNQFRFSHIFLSSNSDMNGADPVRKILPELVPKIVTENVIACNGWKPELLRFTRLDLSNISIAAWLGFLESLKSGKKRARDVCLSRLYVDFYPIEF
jgi:hypothetical protein